MATILIVDDEKHFVQQLSRMVTSFGHNPVSTVYSSYVLKILEENNVDLILLDIYMPEIDGITLLKQLKIHPRFQTIPVIILTADTDEKLLATCFHEGASDFLVKPIKEPVLIARMQSLLNTQRYISTLEAEITEKERLEKQIRHSQKMEALGTLAGGVAHEFNNLLFGIMGYTKLAYDDLPEDSSIRGDLTEVMEAGQKAKDLIQQVLTFSRQTKKERNPIDIKMQLIEALDIMRSKTPDNVEIISNINLNHELALADETQIHQIVLNILQNSLTSLKKNGGVIKLTAENISLSESEVEHLGLKSTEQFKLIFQDNGSGIEQEHLDRIFDPFFTTHSLGEATGLGLSIVHGILQSMGGSIQVENLPTTGCQFIAYFPVYIENSELEEDPIEQKDKKHILLVDDEEIVIVILKKMLRKHGFEVTATLHSDKALDYFRSNPNRYDLIITDQLMPEMTGTQLAEKILEIKPDTPIILTTGYSKSISREASLQIGIREYLMKPIVDEDLMKAIELCWKKDGD